MSERAAPPPSDPGEDEFDHHRRRVLWALPTGLYLIGSRAGDEVNLMTANLVVQVCLEPKLVAVALERESVTARLAAESAAFTISVLHRADRDVVRRFVKPVKDVERAPDGRVTTLAGQAVTEVGEHRTPVLTAAAAYLLCHVTKRDELGSHTLFIGEVVDVSGEPSDVEVLRMEDTRMHYGG